MAAKENQLINTSDAEDTASDEDLSERNWCGRTFGKLRPGSVRGSIFTLAATAMGAGYLAIPKVMEWAGLVLGVGIIIFCGVLNYFSLRTVSQACFKVGINNYAAAAESLLGKGWAILLEIAIIFNALGLIVVLNIIVGTIVPSLFKSIDVDYGRTTERDTIMVLLNLIVVVPLGLMRQLGALRFKAMFNVCSLTFVLFVVIVEFPFYIPQNNYEKLSYANVDLDIFSAFALGLFAFLCHQNLARMQGELVNSNGRRMRKVALRSIILMGILFTTLSVFGYLSLLNDVPSLIVMRKAPDDISNDWAMVVGRLLVALSITIAIPINLYPCRAGIEKLICKVDGTSPLWMHILITMCSILGTLALALFYPNITFMFNFLGGFCAAVMALIIPSLLFVKMSEKPMTNPKNLAVITGCVLLSGIAFASVVISLFQQIQG